MVEFDELLKCHMICSYLLYVCYTIYIRYSEKYVDTHKQTRRDLRIVWLFRVFFHTRGLTIFLFLTTLCALSVCYYIIYSRYLLVICIVYDVRSAELCVHLFSLCSGENGILYKWRTMLKSQRWEGQLRSSQMKNRCRAIQIGIKGIIIRLEFRKTSDEKERD